MNLLPNNAKLTDQSFALLIDTKSTIGFTDLDINPLDCEASLLEHIALIKGANIDNMLEHEARLYLSTFTKKTVGTVGAVEDVVNVCFDDAKLVEWFEDKENLKRGMFNIDVNLKDDTSLVYDDRLFALSTRLINNAKNVRSKLDSFNLKIQSAGHVGYTSVLVQDINLKNEFKPHISTCAFEILHGALIAVELENSAYQNQQSEININTRFGGVMDVNLKNELIFKNESNADLIIKGGVTWVF